MSLRLDSTAPRTNPPNVSSHVWLATDFVAAEDRCRSTGWAQLDAELPGGGWPCSQLTECLTAQYAVSEWRLVAPAPAGLATPARPVVAIGPTRRPHMAGLDLMGIPANALRWIRADTPAERLWCTERLIRANATAAVLSWLPQARPEQIRRLQVLSQANEGLTFVFRPIRALQQASAASLRLVTTVGIDWQLQVQLAKRRGPPLAEAIALPSIPGGLARHIAPRMRRPSLAIATREATHAGRPAAVGHAAVPTAEPARPQLAGVS